MPAPLATSGDLIVGAWINFRKNLAVYGEFAIWFAVLAVVRWAVTVAVSASVTDRELRYALELLLSLPVYFLHTVLVVAIIDAVARHLDRRAGTVRESLYAGFHHVFPVIWTWLVGGAVLAAGLTMVIGGTLTPPAGLVFVLPGAILILPGIWLSVRLFGAGYGVTVDGLGAGAALKASAKQVTDRWWATFSRILFPWIFFYVAAYFVIHVAYLLFGSVLGDPGLFFGQVSATQDMPNTHRLVKAVISETIDGAALPIFVAAGLLLWNDLKRTA